MNSNPVAVVTGASRGIGRAVTVALAAEGYDIVAVSRSVDSDAMNLLSQEVHRLGRHFFPVGLDVSQLERHEEIISLIAERYGRIDFLVLNCVVAPPNQCDLLEMSPEGFDSILSVSLKGPLFFAKGVAREMIWLRSQRPDVTPSIVFVTSSAAAVSMSCVADFCIAKAGLSMASMVFADRLAEEGINVYEVRPGLISNDSAVKVKEEYDNMISNGVVPQGRWGTPDEVAKGIASIAGGDWNFSTGMVFEVSGGLCIRSVSRQNNHTKITGRAD